MPLKMTLNPGNHEFTLSDSALTAMAATLWHTRVKERGNALCVERHAPAKLTDGVEFLGEMVAGREHIGGPGSITQRDCPGKRQIGHYHTHPEGTADPSWWDAYAIVAESARLKTPYLGCRASKQPIPEGQIQCQTVSFIPTEAEVLYLKAKRRKKRWVSAIDDPEISMLITDAYSFPARKVPEIVKPPAPMPAAPRIKVEELVFTSSAFKKYTNLDTGQSWTERTY